MVVKIKEINMELSKTISKNYNSAKFTIGVVISVADGELHKAYRTGMNYLQTKMDEEIPQLREALL